MLWNRSCRVCLVEIQGEAEDEAPAREVLLELLDRLRKGRRALLARVPVGALHQVREHFWLGQEQDRGEPLIAWYLSVLFR